MIDGKAVKLANSVIKPEERDAALRLLIVCTRKNDIELALDVLAKRFKLTREVIAHWYQAESLARAILPCLLLKRHRLASLSLAMNEAALYLQKTSGHAPPATLHLWPGPLRNTVPIAEVWREADKYVV